MNFSNTVNKQQSEKDLIRKIIVRQHISQASTKFVYVFPNYQDVLGYSSSSGDVYRHTTKFHSLILDMVRNFMYTVPFLSQSFVILGFSLTGEKKSIILLLFELHARTEMCYVHDR